MTTTPFDSLPQLQGHPELREVNGTWMDRERYEIEEWHVLGEYPSDRGPIRYWQATLPGLQRYGRLLQERRQERRSAWQNRVDAEEAYSDSIQQLIEEGTKR